MHIILPGMRQVVFYLCKLKKSLKKVITREGFFCDTKSNTEKKIIFQEKEISGMLNVQLLSFRKYLQLIFLAAIDEYKIILI